jgi:hypothetical protein
MTVFATCYVCGRTDSVGYGVCVGCGAPFDFEEPEVPVEPQGEKMVEKKYVLVSSSDLLAVVSHVPNEGNSAVADLCNRLVSAADSQQEIYVVSKAYLQYAAEAQQKVSRMVGMDIGDKLLDLYASAVLTGDGPSVSALGELIKMRLDGELIFVSCRNGMVHHLSIKGKGEEVFFDVGPQLGISPEVALEYVKTGALPAGTQIEICKVAAE